MTAMTDAQRTRLQRKLDITDDETVFTDLELDDIWDEAGEVFDIAHVIGIREIAFSATKLNSYTAGQTSEEIGETFNRLMAFLKYYEDTVAGAGNQVLILGTGVVPPFEKEVPAGHEHPAEKGLRHNTTLFRWRRYGSY